MSSRITAHTPVRTTRRRARALAISAAGLAVAFALSACSGSTLPAATGGATEGAGAPASDYDAIIASAPKADEATIADSEWATRIKEAGVLKTGGSDSGPLWSLKDPATGKIEGFDAGLSQMLAQYILGEPKTDLTITTVDTRETLLQNNTVDTVFATYSITPQRAEKIDFAGPYYMSGTSIQVKSDTTDISSYKDLAGKTVVTQANSTGVTTLEEFAPDAKVITFTDNAQCVAALVQGRADAYVIDESILIANAVKDPTLKVVGEPFTEDPYGIGVNKDGDAKAFVNAWLQKIYDDGSWAKLWKATVGTVVEGDAPTPPVIGSADGS